MRIYVMTDLEGSAGVLDSENHAHPDDRYYEQARQLVTEETNAAIAGLADAGAKQFLVVDGHGCGAIDPVVLDPRAELLSHPQGYPFECDASFDAAVMVGQHAKSNTDGGHLCHTGSFLVEELTVNGISMGEAGKNMLMAGYFGVPTILLCGDEAACAEAEALVPEITCAPVKRGVPRGSAGGLTQAEAVQFNRQAIHPHPTVARRRIRRAARQALRRLKRVKPLVLDPPYTLVVTLRPQDGKGPMRATARDTDVLRLLGKPLQFRPMRKRRTRQA